MKRLSIALRLFVINFFVIIKINQKRESKNFETGLFGGNLQKSSKAHIKLFAQKGKKSRDAKVRMPGDLRVGCFDEARKYARFFGKIQKLKKAIAL